jgi:hypothetical protein
MTIPDPKFRLGDIVFHVTDDQPGVVIGYALYRTHMAYLVAWNTCSHEEHGDAELTTKRPDWDSSYSPGND